MKIDKDEIASKVAAIYKSQRTYISDLKVEVTTSTLGLVVVRASAMYEHLPLTFAILEKLAEVFGTKDFT